VRAVVLSAFGPPGNLHGADVPAPVAGAGQVTVDVEWASITFVETQIRAGRPPNPAMAPALPVILGNGVGGVVADAGEDVVRSWVGRRVVTTTGGSGGYAERVAVDAANLIAVPDALALDDAVALLADGRTAMALFRAANVAGGDTVLVEAAAGGLGSLLVQLAHHAGARVVAAAGNDRKLQLARELGADAAVDYTKIEWPALLRSEVGDVDVAFDGVGGEIGRAAFELVRPGGSFVPFGMASGAFATVGDEDAERRDVSVIHLPRLSLEAMSDLTRDAFGEAVEGRLRPVIGQVFPLEDAAAAHAAIEARATIGKTLLSVANREAA